MCFIKKFQNFLRNQNNKNNYNLVCETLQFLDCICGSTTGGLGLLGLYINEKNVGLINQTVESLTEYCQGPCHENQVIHTAYSLGWAFPSMLPTCKCFIWISNYSILRPAPNTIFRWFCRCRHCIGSQVFRCAAGCPLNHSVSSVWARIPIFICTDCEQDYNYSCVSVCDNSAQDTTLRAGSASVIVLSEGLRFLQGVCMYVSI